MKKKKKKKSLTSHVRDLEILMSPGGSIKVLQQSKLPPLKIEIWLQSDVRWCQSEKLHWLLVAKKVLESHSNQSMKGNSHGIYNLLIILDLERSPLLTKKTKKPKHNGTLLPRHAAHRASW